MTSPPPFILYLLHFGEPVARARHYVGITTPDGFRRRMRDHMHGRGAKLVQRAAEAGINVYVARTWPVASHDDERKFKKASGFAKRCPICQEGNQPSLPGIRFEPLPTKEKGGPWLPVKWGT